MVEGRSVQPLQATARRGGFVLAIAAIVIAAAAVQAQPAAARAACADAILRDWTAGTLGSSYAPECYEAAIDALPADLRAYTTAADDISRAAISASREAPARQLASSPVGQQSVRDFPAAVAVLAAVVTALALAGLAASLYRRRRAR
ncbi:MAG TPA: hypothetical protein VFO81_16035 [Gaiellaceae bacterium]|nr:hypothetical protein [Gaiellaceae bacterium]